MMTWPAFAAYAEGDAKVAGDRPARRTGSLQRIAIPRADGPRGAIREVRRRGRAKRPPWKLVPRRQDPAQRALASCVGVGLAGCVGAPVRMDGEATG